mgnify:CR=1 FL=1
MKKVFYKSVIKTAAAFVFALLFLSCEIGLGPQIDLEAPVVKLTSHKDNDAVASSFRLEGTAYDNEGVTRLSIDFDDKDIHYYITTDGVWHKKTSSTEWVAVSSDKASVSYSGTHLTWSVEVDSSDAAVPGSTFSFTIIAEDKVGNSSKNSKVDCSLIVDENLPSASIIKPELFTAYSTAQQKFNSYALKDANVLSRLLNGTVTLSGRLDGALSTRELLLEFDNGTSLPSTVTGYGDADTTVASIAEANDFGASKTYFSKTLKVNENGITDLRSWTFDLKQSDWIYDGNNEDLKTEKHLIRVVATSLSNANAYERKVLGWFVWWPEADAPWITMNNGALSNDLAATSQIYPSSKLSGQVQDDDGIKSLVYSMYRRENDGNYSLYNSIQNVNISLAEANTKSSAWSVSSPNDNGVYKIVVTATDLGAKTDVAERYFTIMDVQPPKITITSPENGSSALARSDSNIVINGIVSDDGTVTSLKMVYLNPNLGSNPDNKIKYMSSSESDWQHASSSGYVDSLGNILYKLDLGSPTYSSTENKNSYSFSKTLNLFTDLGIGVSKKLSSQDFVFLATDSGGTSTVLSFSLTGDTEAPQLTFDTIKLLNSSGTKRYPEGSAAFDMNGSDIPNFPVINTGDKAVLTGTWSDNSTSAWKNISKIGDIKITWQGNETLATKKTDGTWTATITDVPHTSGVITVSLMDYGENSKTVTKSVFVESSSAGLERIASDSDDGSYAAGQKINISLEFTKNTTVEGTPSLKLNNGKTAVYKEGSGKAKHVFEYTVAAGDDVDRLLVTGINSSGVTWRDASTNGQFNVTLPTENAKTLSSRNIRIDTKSPKISSVTAITGSGAYKENSSILLMMEFSEDVTVESDDSLSDALKLNFTHGKTSTGTLASGSKIVLFTYDVAAGDNSSELKLDSVVHDSSVKVLDSAKNELTDWSLPSESLANKIVIDTQKPSVPAVNPAWSGNFVSDENGTSFTVSGETGATIEYSLDGSSWQTYKGPVSLTNNGTYTITARQTDKAGNVSDQSDIRTVTVDKGELLNLISAETVNGTYSCNTATSTITGVIEFRKSVKIPSGASVTLNVKNGSSNSKVVPINEAGTERSRYTFTYTIQEGDYTEENLDVTAWSFNTVTLGLNEVSVSLPATTSDKRFTSNREIKILTGRPSVVSWNFTGEGKDAKLIITYDRVISKVSSKEITFEMAASDFKIPAVLTPAEYSSLLSEIPSLGTYYKEGVNGASIVDSNLVNDTASKYILDYAYDDNNETIRNLFTAKDKHKVTVPVKASAVKVSGKTLTVSLGSLYALPVKGADYTLTIPEGTVVDAVKNENAEMVQTVTSEGIEAPVIRINKVKQTISSTGITSSSSVKMPETAAMKISCRTPGATIKFAVSGGVDNNVAKGQESTLVHVNKSPQFFQTKTSDPAAPSITSSSLTYSVPITLGEGNNENNTLDYDTVKGLKFAITAQSSKNGSTATAYEYATRTVLKFVVSGNYDAGNGNNGDTQTTIKENGNTLYFRDLKVWIIGGDAPSGGNASSATPLSWADSRNFKLMKGALTNNYNMYGTWYWITWDVSAATYHGFAIGDVPSDAQDNGPTEWYVSECAWVAQKENYVLYPGETLEMAIENEGVYQATFMFRIKNKGTR